MFVQEVKEYGFRDSAFIGNDRLSVLINSEMGMVPQLNCRKGDGWINAHWQPIFRANSGHKWDPQIHEDFWKVPLLYHIAGNFPCCPNFGPGHEVEGYNLPPHGFTSLLKWDLKALEQREEIVFAKWTLSTKEHPFAYEKTDMVRKDDYSHYMSLKVTNTGTKAEPYNFGWHNTVGAPFLEKGCLINNNAKAFAVPEEGTEFDTTGRLAMGAICESMTEVPTRDGKTVNLKKVPGPIGYTDLLSGAVPEECKIAWSSVTNPKQKLLYMSFFQGPSAVQQGEMPLHFYNYWMNYGGRNFKPWAPMDGSPDQSFCLGAENSIGHFANGLASSLKNPTLLGHPTYKMLEPGESVVLNYGTMFLPYDGNILDKGVYSVEGEEDKLVIEGEGGYMKAHGLWDFSLLKSLGQ